MSLKILVDENIPAVEDYLGRVGRIQRVKGRTLEAAQLRDVDVLLVRSVTRVDEALLADSPVKFVGTATSGLDHIDRDYLRRRGIAFAHAPGANANSVVEYVLAAIAAVGEKLEHLLAGGSVGVVGYGHIGKAVAARLKALGIDHCIYDPWLDRDGIPNAAGLKQVLDCNVVTLHPELTTEQPWPSFHLLGACELQRLRADALLINASRGAVVDNAALLAQLEAGRGPVSVLDVWEGEPEVSPALLARVRLGTAHIAGYSHDGKLLATRMLSDAVIAAFRLPILPAEHSKFELPALAVSDTWSSAALVRHLVQARYDIGRDDALLRQAVAEPTPGRGERFDLLRKSYRERRELAGARVRGAAQPGHIALIRALGCVPEPGNSN